MSIWFDRATKFSIVTCGKGCVSRGAATHFVVGAGPQRGQSFFGTCYLRAYGMKILTQIFHDDQIRSEENFCTVDHALCPGQKTSITATNAAHIGKQCELLSAYSI